MNNANNIAQEEARTTRLKELKDITSSLRAMGTNDRSRALAETQKLLDTTTEDISTITKSIEDLSGTSTLSARFASLTLAMQATKISDEPILSKRQHLIAQGEAKAFMNALNPSNLPLGDEEEDPIEALQTVLDQSTIIAEAYGRKSKPITKETYTDCMVSVTSFLHGICNTR